MTFAQQQILAQQQESCPGSESEKIAQPKADDLKVQGSGKLCNKVALITGGDSGIGRAVAIAFAKEGADVAIVYRNERDEAEKTKQMVEQQGRSCLTLAGNVCDEEFCEQAVQQTINQFGKLDVLVNNAIEQDAQESVKDISAEQLESNLQTNLCPMFYMTNAALPYLPEGSTIINTTSVRAYKGNEQLPDSSANRGAIMTFTRSLSQSLEDKGIRVNGVAPGPVWTLLVPSTVAADKVEEFGKQVPMGDHLPEDIAPSFVFLASDEASYMAGQIVFTRSVF